MRYLVVLLLLTALSPATAVETVLDERFSGNAVLDGEADEQLRAIGRRAASENLALQVTAPDLWERRILEPIHAGAGEKELIIEFVNALSDTVEIQGIPADQAEDPLETLKRITQNAKARAAGAGAERRPVERQASGSPQRPENRPRPDIERPSTEIPEMKVERPRASLPAPGFNGKSGAEKRDSADPSKTGTQASAHAMASEPAPAADSHDATHSTAAADSASRTPPSTVQAAVAEDGRGERALFERLYNQGRAIEARLDAFELKPGDLVFTGEHWNVVVRRGISSEAYWLEGEMPGERVAHVERNKYRVVAAAPEPESRSESTEPPGVAAERERFERLYNSGRDITEYLQPSELKPGDALYVGETVTTVVRRNGVGLTAYWLGKPLRLDQPGLAHEKKNKYVVVGELETED